jgi:hypothetical protein
VSAALSTHVTNRVTAGGVGGGGGPEQFVPNEAPAEAKLALFGSVPTRQVTSVDAGTWPTVNAVGTAPGRKVSLAAVGPSRADGVADADRHRHWDAVGVGVAERRRERPVAGVVVD